MFGLEQLFTRAFTGPTTAPTPTAGKGEKGAPAKELATTSKQTEEVKVGASTSAKEGRKPTSINSTPTAQSEMADKTVEEPTQEAVIEETKQPTETATGGSNEAEIKTSPEYLAALAEKQ